ncbi:UNVERIFIED_CONTAM: hypothetical protein OHV15_07965 [Microbacterium sp. SLM126]
MTSADTNEPLRARVAQLAGVLGLSPTETLLKLTPLGPLNDASWVPLPDVDKALEGFTPRRDPAELRASILAAFEAARDARGENWQTMPLPVLKNRLLTLTNGAFHEWDYGWPNLRFLPHSYPDLLSLDDSTPHGAAVYVAAPALREQTDTAAPTSRAHGGAPRTDGRRIREDLWNAIVDYRDGLTYVWDQKLGRAVGVEGEAGAGALVFPTIGADDVRAWRQECARRWAHLNGDADNEAIEGWVENPRTRVPQRFLNSWRSDQRNRVAAIIEGFFESSGLDLPSDAFPPAGPVRTELTARELVRLAAEVMTDTEVDALQLPVGAVLRALQHGGHVR